MINRLQFPSPQCRRQLRAEHFDRNAAGELQILRKVDDRHPAAAEFPVEGVALGERSLEAIEEIGHREEGCRRLIWNASFRKTQHSRASFG